MLHRLYASFPLLNFWPTNIPTYCNIGSMAAVYVRIMLGLGDVKQFLGRALRLVQATGPSAAARTI